MRLPRLALIQRIGELIGVLYVGETAFWFRMGVDTAATTFTGIQTKERLAITTQLPVRIVGGKLVAQYVAVKDKDCHTDVHFCRRE